MLLKKEINLNYLENWPEHYYEIKDINERENILKSYIEKNPDSLDDQNRLQLLQKRFVCLKDHKRADLFMRGWINSKTLTTENIHFFNKKRIEKEFRQCLEDLCILNYERSPILHEEWKSFAQEFILSCIDSHSYKQVAVGIGHVSDKMLRCVLLETSITSQKNSLHISCLKMNAKSFMISWLKHINRCLKMVNSIGMITVVI